jgi:hypothetical protein
VNSEGLFLEEILTAHHQMREGFEALPALLKREKWNIQISAHL